MELQDTNLRWPSDREINAWTDYAELICMLHIDGELSLQSFADWINDNVDKTPKQKLSAINFSEVYLAKAVASSPLLNPLIVVVSEDQDNLEDDMEDLDVAENDEVQKNDEPAEQVINEIALRLQPLWVMLAARSAQFGDSYPFEVSPEGPLLKLRIEELTIQQRLYLVLLFSSQMQAFAPADINRLGHCFEALCKLPLEKLVPRGATMRFFGAGAGDLVAAEHIYNGHNLAERLRMLANDLSIDTTSYLKDEDEVSAGGDASLDWVAFLSFNDNVPHQPVFFAQCACGSNWIDKQHEAQQGRWQRFLHVRQSIQYIHFVPRSFRRDTLKWQRGSLISDDLVVIDRYRLIHLMRSESEIVTTLLTPYADLIAQKNSMDLY
jgi:hypothetical protein